MCKVRIQMSTHILDFDFKLVLCVFGPRKWVDRLLCLVSYVVGSCIDPTGVALLEPTMVSYSLCIVVACPQPIDCHFFGIT